MREIKTLVGRIGKLLGVIIGSAGVVGFIAVVFDVTPALYSSDPLEICIRTTMILTTGTFFFLVGNSLTEK